MVTRTPPSYEHAERFFADLNDRQLTVLQLIAAGRTNAEIAEELEMTLAGAKWNVSEILTKLGFDVREEAAEFYRWYTAKPRRLQRLLRGLIALGPLKAAAVAGSAGVVALAVIGLVGAIGGTSNVSAEPGLPFYLEASTLTTINDSQTQTLSKWWQEDSTHARIEDGPPVVIGPNPNSESFGDSTAISVSDGTTHWAWSTGLTLYSGDNRLEPANEAHRGLEFLGPLDEQAMDAYLTSLRTDYPGATVTTTAGGLVLGRRVMLVERSSTMAMPDGSTGQNLLRLWVDPERMFVMRAESHPAIGPAVVATVTSLKYGEEQPASEFVWDPPAGTHLITCTPDNKALLAGVLPKPFISVPSTAIPGGFAYSGIGVATAADGTCGQAHAAFEQSPSGLAAPGHYLQVGENIEDPQSVISATPQETRTIRGDVAASAWMEGDVALLAWVHDGLGVQLKSSVLTIDELATFGEAMLADPPLPGIAPDASTSAAVR